MSNSRWTVVSEIPATECPAAPTESGVIGGTDLMPPDGHDSFWDTPYASSTRRKIFCLRWGLDPSSSRSQMIAAIAGNPAKTRAHTTELTLWACTREELDQKFEQDIVEVKKLLAAAGLEFSIDGLNEFVKQIEARGEPLVEFQKRTYDPDGIGLPQLGRSTAGLLLDMIGFVATWPTMRNTHQAL